MHELFNCACRMKMSSISIKESLPPLLRQPMMTAVVREMINSL